MQKVTAPLTVTANIGIAMTVVIAIVTEMEAESAIGIAVDVIGVKTAFGVLKMPMGTN